MRQTDGMFDGHLPHADAPHAMPEGDHFAHTESPLCPCGPLFQTAYVRAIGGAFWWQHMPVAVTLDAAPDALPEDWS